MSQATAGNKHQAALQDNTMGFQSGNRVIGWKGVLMPLVVTFDNGGLVRNQYTEGIESEGAQGSKS